MRRRRAVDDMEPASEDGRHSRSRVQTRALGRERALLDVTRALAGHLDEAQVLQLAVRHAARLLDADYARLRLLEPDGWLRCVAARGMVRADTLNRRLPPTSASALVLREGVLNLADAPAHPAWNRELYGSQGRMHAYLGVGVRRADEMLGILEVMRASVGAFTPDEVRVLEALADAAAIAVDNARLIQQRLQQVRREEAIRARERLILAVAHDLGSPLSAIRGRVGLARRHLARGPGPQGAAVQAELDRIDLSARRLADMLSDLADVVRLEAGHPMRLSRRPTDLVALVRACVDEQAAGLGDTPVTVVAEVEQLVGMWDAARLRRVVDNLLTNARKYSPTGAPITITVAREPSDDAAGRAGAWATIAVEDRGIGIDGRELGHVFDLFERGSNAGDVPGSGIGLASTREIVERHGGRIRAESREGAGSRFTVRLPLRAPEAETSTASEPAG